MNGEALGLANQLSSTWIAVGGGDAVPHCSRKNGKLVLEYGIAGAIPYPVRSA